MIETKVQIAADLLPLIQHLWKGGVLSIGTYSNSIHLQDTLFHETLPTPAFCEQCGQWLPTKSFSQFTQWCCSFSS